MGLLSTAFFVEGRLFEELSAAVDDVGAGGEGGEGGGAIEGYGGSSRIFGAFVKTGRLKC